jgi:hypothetical protein
MPNSRSFRLRALPICLAVLPLLSACVPAGGSTVRSTSRTALVRPPVRQPARTPPRGAVVHMMPGLEGVIGATPAQLTSEFGAPRLDEWEGDARKLQFSGTPCVLDVYLYPEPGSREPQATYVDARRASDGQDVDRAACVAALRKR